MSNRRILIIAGPNGAGKTTFAREFLTQEANCPTFINADLIAAGLAPFEPGKAAIQAGKLMLKAIESNVNDGKSFASETTLSGGVYSKNPTMASDWISHQFIFPKTGECRDCHRSCRRACTPVWS